MIHFKKRGVEKFLCEDNFLRQLLCDVIRYSWGDVSSGELFGAS